EGDLDRGLAEEDRMVADSGLHPPAALALGDLPGLVVETGEVGHGIAGSGGDDEPGLHLLGVDGRRGQIEPDPGPVVAVLGGDEDPVADYEELFPGEFHWRLKRGKGNGGRGREPAAHGG